MSLIGNLTVPADDRCGVDSQWVTSGWEKPRVRFWFWRNPISQIPRCSRSVSCAARQRHLLVLKIKVIFCIKGSYLLYILFQFGFEKKWMFQALQAPKTFVGFSCWCCFCECHAAVQRAKYVVGELENFKGKFEIPYKKVPFLNNINEAEPVNFFFLHYVSSASTSSTDSFMFLYSTSFKTSSLDSALQLLLNLKCFQSARLCGKVITRLAWKYKGNCVSFKNFFNSQKWCVCCVWRKKWKHFGAVKSFRWDAVLKTI